jgi:hypothetical protein
MGTAARRSPTPFVCRSCTCWGERAMPLRAQGPDQPHGLQAVLPSQHPGEGQVIMWRQNKNWRVYRLTDLAARS